MLDAFKDLIMLKIMQIYIGLGLYAAAVNYINHACIHIVVMESKIHHNGSLSYNYLLDYLMVEWTDVYSYSHRCTKSKCIATLKNVM